MRTVMIIMLLLLLNVYSYFRVIVFFAFIFSRVSTGTPPMLSTSQFSSVSPGRFEDTYTFRLTRHVPRKSNFATVKTESAYGQI